MPIPRIPIPSLNACRLLAWVGVMLLMGGLVHLNIQSYQERQELRMQVDASRMARRALFRQIGDMVRDFTRIHANLEADVRRNRDILREIGDRLTRMEEKLDRAGDAGGGEAAVHP